MAQIEALIPDSDGTFLDTVSFIRHAHHLEGMNFDKLHNMLNSVQDRIAKEHIKPYEGLLEFLHGLGETGIPLAIFTSGTLHHIVRNFGIALPKIGMQDAHTDTSKSDEEKLREFEVRLTVLPDNLIKRDL